MDIVDWISIGFILIMFFSLFWAKAKSLAWDPISSWCMIISLFLVIRNIELSCRSMWFYHKILALAFYILLLVNVVMVLLSVPLDETWHLYLGKNHNYTSAFLISLSPYALTLNASRAIENIIKGASVIFLILILFYTSTKGVLLFFIIGLLLFIFLERKSYRVSIPKHRLIWIVPLLLFIGILFVHSPIYTDIIAVSTEGRKYMSWISFKLMLESNLMGVGIGNWYIEAYKYNVDSISGIGHPLSFKRALNHSQTLNIGAELGLLGLILFIYPFLKSIRKSFLFWDDYSPFLKSCMLNSFIYILLTFVYYTMNSHVYHFSGIQCLAFISLGFILSKSKH